MTPARRTAISVTAAVLAVCALVAVLGWWLSRGSSRRPTAHVAVAASPSSAVVPWVDRPATPLPLASPTVPPPEYPDCVASELAVDGVRSGAAAGTVFTNLRLTNVGSTACTLRGFPTSFTGVRADGSAEQLRASHYEQGEWPANLLPRQSGSVVVVTGDNCPALNQPTPQPDPYVGETVGIPGGGTLSADAPFDASCGLSIGALGVQPPPLPDPHAYPGLSLTVDRPSTVPAGTTMRFTVTLTNTSATTVDLSPCPVYVEGIVGARAYSGPATYELNCDHVTEIAPGDSVTYAMQLAVPDAPGPAKFFWNIPASVNLGGAGLITIT